MYGLLLVALAWISLHTVDMLLRAYYPTHSTYKNWIIQHGISISIVQIRWFTKRLNRIFYRIANINWFPWWLWFHTGVFVSAVLMLFSVIILTVLVFNTMTQRPIDQQIITPVMPGVNLPMSHMGFFMLTLLCCTILHEMGHAVAAIRERVRVEGFGMLVFAVYPGAFVALNSADLAAVMPVQRLRVFCAGVWHNLVIVALALATNQTLPSLLAPFYMQNSGVLVSYLHRDSVVGGPRALQLGDTLHRVNSCPVRNIADWSHCLHLELRYPPAHSAAASSLSNAPANHRFAASDTLYKSLPYEAFIQGHCMPLKLISRLDISAANQQQHQSANPASNQHPISAPDCCHSQSATHLCFFYFSAARNIKQRKRFACLPARTVTDRPACFHSSQCVSLLQRPPPFHHQFKQQQLQHYKSERSAANQDVAKSNVIAQQQQLQESARASIAKQQPTACVKPHHLDNSTRLIRLVYLRRGHARPAILFLGSVADLSSSVGFSEYIPRWPLLLPAHLPYYLATLIKYLVSISGALAIFNAVPCYALDGQYILFAMIELLLPPFCPSARRRHQVFVVVLALGTLLLATNLLLALYFFVASSPHFSGAAALSSYFGGSGNSPSSSLSPAALSSSLSSPSAVAAAKKLHRFSSVMSSSSTLSALSLHNRNLALRHSPSFFSRASSSSSMLSEVLFRKPNSS